MRGLRIASRTAASSPRAQRKQTLPGAASCSCGASLPSRRGHRSQPARARSRCREARRHRAPARASRAMTIATGFADMAHALARKRPARRLRHRLAVGAADRPQRRHRTDMVGGHVGAGEDGDDARRGRRRAQCRSCGCAHARAASARSRSAVRRAMTMSATKRPAPRRNCASSTRRTDAPMPSLALTAASIAVPRAAGRAARTPTCRRR